VNSESDDRDQVNVLSSSRKLAFVIAVILLFGLGTVTETANAVAPQLFTTAKQATPSADAHVAQNFPAKNYGSSWSLAVYGTPNIVSYLKFTLPTPEAGQTLVGATLKIKTTTAASDGSRDTLSVYRAGN